MEIAFDNSKWYDRMLAAFSAFTNLRLPAGYHPSVAAQRGMIEFWPLTGWLTGCTTALVLFLTAQILPYWLVLLAAIGARLAVGGGKEERALLRFALTHVFGKSPSRPVTTADQIAALLASSAVLWLTWQVMDVETAALVIVAGDCYAKMVAGQLTLMLPRSDYGLGEPVFRRMSVAHGLLYFAFGILPLVFLMAVSQLSWHYPVFVPCLVLYAGYLFLRQRLQGYTTDALLSAAFLLQLVFTLTVIVQQWPAG